jgi:hypothetical protein
MRMGAGGITTIATARSAQRLRTLSRVCLGRALGRRNSIRKVTGRTRDPQGINHSVDNLSI